METRTKKYRRRTLGQSIPLIALMIVVLVAMVGLSVDVGNTFSQERRVVAAANASSIAGMNFVFNSRAGDTSAMVYNQILQVLTANGIDVAAYGQTPNSNQLQLTAVYLDKDGRAIAGASSITPDNTNAIPTNDVAFIQVRLEGQVDTYFARVVGRNDLPIGASAYAGKCPIGQGVYPFAIDRQTLTDDLGQFRQVDDANWRVIPSGPFATYTARRVYPKDNDSPGNFGFLRWKEANKSAVDAENSLRGFGNLSDGFEEAPLPSGVVDVNYPALPGILSPGDWVWGSTGMMVGKAWDAMQEHQALGTRMILPLYNPPAADNGANSRYNVTGFGVFVILASDNKGKNNTYFDLVYLGQEDALLGACSFSPVPPNEEDCCEVWGDVALTPAYQNRPTEYNPIQWVIVLDQSGSMSANFNGQCDVGGGGNIYSSQGPLTVDGVPQPSVFTQCTNGPVYTRPNGSTIDGNSETDGTGASRYWRQYTERRMFIAKQAIQQLIDTAYFGTDDPNRPPDQFAYIWYTGDVNSNGNAFIFKESDGSYVGIGTPGSGQSYFSSNKAVLKKEIDKHSTGTIDVPERDTTHPTFGPDKIGKRYVSNGGTNGTAGLFRASRVLSASRATTEPWPKDGQPPTVTPREFTYLRVVLFITDGVSNQFFNQNAGNYHAFSSPGTYGADTWGQGRPGAVEGTHRAFCRGLETKQLIDTAICHTNSGGGTYVKDNVLYNRPINQSIEVSNTWLKGTATDTRDYIPDDRKAQTIVYAVGISPLNQVYGGLSSGQIASDPINGFETGYVVSTLETDPVTGRNNLDILFESIGRQVQDLACVPREGDVRTDMRKENLSPGSTNLIFKLKDGKEIKWPTVGLVTLTPTEGGSGGNLVTEIKVNEATNQLYYRFTDRVRPGTYTLNAWLLYHDSDDQDPYAMPRRYDVLWDGVTAQPNTTIQVSARTQVGSFKPSTQVDLHMRFPSTIDVNVCADNKPRSWQP
ncbi:TadE/TadG family type IV pilus assembly protein [Candidatus Chloroploca asiatica]|uniref:Putative Flp pilus-assembly TadG-like N-terminal domain-containing protein n=1 Tax=Candidatus Chloroploca asiatica TaxID=1506545 RepID=A0A2H3KZV0_9CHLR|nr:pilus assembly protein TadG-related protein [Candidatus Chloroploca asiatica]PDV96417.1 hypothetical protein A9Q02_06895 [Candidatus Chloroploca asiatica]